MSNEPIKYIKRHDGMTRAWHWNNIISGLILTITGILIFVPFFGQNLPPQVMTISTWGHRIFGVIFSLFFVAWVVITPKNIIHSFKEIFSPWDSRDKDFMIKFIPYLFKPGKYHMPKQNMVKSGQRLSDFFLYLIIVGFIATGVVMLIGTPIIPSWFFAISLLLHDICFMGFIILMGFHLYLGAGIFQPYTSRAATWMLGTGYVSEADALYHWGQWAEDQLDDGENVIVKNPDESLSEAIKRQA